MLYQSHHGEKAVWIRCKLPGDILVTYTKLLTFLQ